MKREPNQAGWQSYRHPNDRKLALLAEIYGINLPALDDYIRTLKLSPAHLELRKLRNTARRAAIGGQLETARAWLTAVHIYCWGLRREGFSLPLAQAEANRRRNQSARLREKGQRKHNEIIAEARALLVNGRRPRGMTEALAKRHDMTARRINQILKEAGI